MIPLGWSVGDLLTAISVIIKSVKALDETKGAKAEYQELMSELYTLERVLLAIKSLDIDQSSSSEGSALQKAIQGFQACIDDFCKTNEKYQSLTAGPSTAKDQLRKLKWALGHKDDVQKFREALGKKTASLDLLLGTMQLRHARSSEETVSRHAHEQARLLGETQAAMTAQGAEQMQLLRQIEGLLRDSPATKAESKPSGSRSSFVLPFKLTGAPLASVFVQRPDIMQNIEDHLLPVPESQQSVLVLQGMGGMGKSQMAREYAWAHKHDYSAVFWVNATSESILKNEIAGIAQRLGLNHVLDISNRVPKDEASIDKAISAVHEWFNQDGNTKWLLILDNVDSQIQPDLDDDEEERPSSVKVFDALPYLPKVSQGTLLMTSRLSYLARAVGGISIRIDQMTLNQALEVLCKLSRRDSSEPGAEELVQRLGCYPLALSQCGRYIDETQDSFVKYLSRFETRLNSLLKQNPGRHEYQNGSIVATLGLSYEVLKARNPTAAGLLAFCGCLDNTDIFWEIFENNASDSLAKELLGLDVPVLPWIPGLDQVWFHRIQSSEEQYDEAIRSLLVFSFVRRDIGTSSISLHPVVHQWTLSLYGRNIQTAFLEKIAAQCSRYAWYIAGSSVASSHEATINRLRPHADRCIALVGNDLASLDWEPATLICFGVFFSHQYQLHCAKLLIESGFRRLECEEVDVTSETPLILRAMVDSVYYKGLQVDDVTVPNIKAALEAVRSSMLLNKAKTIEWDYFFTAHLAGAYVTQGKQAEAFTVLDQLIERYAKEDTDPLMYWKAIVRKAWVKYQAGDYASAVELSEEALYNLIRLGALDDRFSGAILARLYRTLGWAHARLDNDEKERTYLSSALISAEKYWGPADLSTLHYAKEHYLTVREREDKSYSPRYDPWRYVFDIVRTSVRHRPGTALYNRLFEELFSTNKQVQSALQYDQNV